MSDALFKIVQTTKNKVATIPIVSGTLYFCTDTREIFVDEIGENPQRIAYPAIPENLSDFNNDVGFITNSELGEEFVKKTGDTMTGNLKLADHRYLTGIDSEDHNTNLIGHNGVNLWIGGYELNSYHHSGETYISTGYNSDTQNGNPTLRVAVPNADNTGGSRYYVYHTNYRPYHYGVCSTAGNVAAKVVTTSVGGPGFVLSAGSIVFVKFSQINTAADPTLNVDGTGAKAIKRYGTTAAGSTVATSWYANSVVGFIYDGTQFQMMNWLNTDTDTTYSEATTSTAGLLSAADKSKLNRAVLTTTDVYNNNGTVSSGSIWSNNTNKIGIGVTQVSDKQNYRLYARADHIAFSSFPTSGDNYTPGSTETKLWTIYPTSGTSPITVTNGKISHANSGVSAGTIGTNSTTALTPGFGSTFSVPGFAVNATGHVTSASSHTVKIPNTAATTSAAGLMSAADKTTVNQQGYYDPGSTYTFEGTSGGHITSSSKDLVFSIPLTAFGTNINIPTGTYKLNQSSVFVLTSVRLQIREVTGGYIIPNGAATGSVNLFNTSSPNLANMVNATITKTLNSIYFTLKCVDGAKWVCVTAPTDTEQITVSNNTPIGVDYKIGLKLTS